MSILSLRAWSERTELTWRGEERRKHSRRSLAGEGTMSWIDGDELAWCFEVTFVDVSSGGVGVRIEKPVDRGQTAWLLLKDGSSYCAIVCHIRQDDEGFLVGLRVVPDRNALTPWKSDRESVQMKWLDQQGQLRSSPVKVERRGINNIDVTAPRRVPAPGVVMLWDDESICFGASRDCLKTGRHYKIEVELLGDSYRNKLIGQP